MIDSEGSNVVFDRDNKLPILVWPWEDAPQVLKNLSDNGGEDWVAHIPPHFSGIMIPWAESGGFGSCDVNRYQLADGSIVLIGVHS